MLIAIGVHPHACTDRESPQKTGSTVTVPTTTPPSTPVCPTQAPDPLDLRVSGTPHPFESIEIGGRTAYARFWNLEKAGPTGPPVPVLDGRKHDFTFDFARGEAWMRLDGGAPQLVALTLTRPEPPEALFSFAWDRAAPVSANRLISLTDEEAQSLRTLRVQADRFETADLSRLQRLKALELEFTVPYFACSADDLKASLSDETSAQGQLGTPFCLSPLTDPSPEVRRELEKKLAEHMPRWVENARQWLRALPEGVHYLRLENVPTEALDALPGGIEHLELVHPYGPGRELSVENVRGALAVRTLYVESRSGQLSLRGLRALRELRLRDTWVDEAELVQIPQLRAIVDDSMPLGPLLNHPSVTKIDLRGATVGDWALASEQLVSRRLQRLVLVDAKMPDGSPLAPTHSSDVVLHTPLDELRAAMACTTRMVVREHHELCFENSHAWPGMLSEHRGARVAVVRELLSGAQDSIGHPRTCKMPVLDLYQNGRFLLTVEVSDDCRTLTSTLWKSGVSLTSAGADRLCTLLARN